MITVNILSSESSLVNSILYNAAKLISNNTDFIYTNLSSFNRIKNKRDKRKNKNTFTQFMSPFTEKIIEFNQKKIYIFLREKWDPLTTENSVEWPFILELQCEDKETIDSFINISTDVYRNDILNQEKLKDKVTNYLWDDYWEVLNKKPNRSLDSLCFDNNLQYELYDELKDFLSPETELDYISYGIPYKYNILLEGYPGTGKSSIIHAMASELNMNMCTIAFDRELTDKQFMRAFKNVPDNSIIILEDIDTCFKDRTDKDNHIGLTFSGLLNTLDGPASVWRQIIVMTTNFKCNLDEALIRPGRIDKVIHFDYASKKQIDIIFNKFVPNNSELCSQFKKQLKSTKVTTAMLQQYLFTYRKDNKIIENIDELKKMSKDSNYGNDSDLYT